MGVQTRRMDPVKKIEWVNALRSGKYTQGFGALRNEGNYCCLGVLSDVSGLGEWRDDTYHTGLDMSAAVLTMDLTKEFGLTEDGHVLVGGAINGESVSWSLTELNDSGFTFTQIADVIDYAL